MPKYRKKPVEVEAHVWGGGAVAAAPIIEWILNGGGTARYHEPIPTRMDADGNTLPAEHEYLTIETLEGTHRADVGDWIIRGVKGEFYPCKPDIFEATYEAVQESADHVADEKAEAWDDGYRGGWSDRTKSFMEARTYEQEIALRTRNPYQTGESA